MQTLMQRPTEHTTSDPDMDRRWEELGEQLDPKSERRRRPGLLRRAGKAGLALLGAVGIVGPAVVGTKVVDAHTDKPTGMYTSPTSGMRPRSSAEMPGTRGAEQTIPPIQAEAHEPVLEVVDKDGNTTEILTPLSSLPPLQRFENSLNASLVLATTESPDLEAFVSPAAREWAGDLVAAYGQDPDSPQLYFTTVGPDGTGATVTSAPSEGAGEDFQIESGTLQLMRGQEPVVTFGRGSSVSLLPQAGEVDQLSVAHLVPVQPQQG